MKTAQWYEGFGAGFNEVLCPTGVTSDYQAGWLEGTSMREEVERLKIRDPYVDCPECGETIYFD